ncbi:single-stranded DNA-binding protein [Thiobacillus sp.]|uniref:single-stranded DNA-binding protein n=1 Tax=Thiobacillus sp. TaxID=924 RepID=UPI00286E176D|nr:single-stranded DNA-binding protein [Thiobacillus sp.]
MQIIIDVNSTKTVTQSGTSKANKPYEMTKQRGHLLKADSITGEVSAVAIDITLDKGAFPYPVGRYTLDEASVRVNNYGRLEIGFIKLSKIDTPVKAAA